MKTSNGRTFPQRSISPCDLRVLLHESGVAAARVVRRFRLPTCDREDLQQDILLDLLGRLRAFDPNRGTFGAFVGAIAGHRVARLTKTMQRRQAALPMLSLDEPVGGDAVTTLGDTIAETAGSSTPLGQPLNRTAEVELRLDLIRALRAIPLAELNLCAQLIDCTPTEITRSGEYSRASLYRRLRKIRLHLVAIGVSWP